MNVIFDTLNLYYLPQYLPIYRELIRRGHSAEFVCYREKDDEHASASLLAKQGITARWVDNELEASRYYEQVKAPWIIFGNTFYHLEGVHKVSKTAQLGHGIGPKPGYYYKSDTPMTIRFMEGELRLKKAKALYPHCNFVQTGFSKLDPIFNDEEKGIDFAAVGLDPNKKTILYAPTFNPSSLLRFPNKWPLDFSDYNILIKPHSISQTRSSYKAHQKKLKHWQSYDNVYVASLDDISLLPFMKSADILLSEASSTLFEFVALDRPVVVCNFFKLKWSYWGPLRYRFERRFKGDNVVYENIGRHVDAYEQLKQVIPDELAQPQRFAKQREQYTREHVGPTDGKSSARIVDYMEKNIDGVGLTPSLNDA